MVISSPHQYKIDVGIWFFELYRNGCNFISFLVL